MQSKRPAKTEVSRISHPLGKLITTSQISHYDQTYLGGGSYGDVYKVKIKNPYLNNIVGGGKPIEWVYKKSSIYLPEEAEIQCRFYVTFKPIKFRGSYYTYSEYLPGIDLNDYHGKDFSERMTILCQLAEQMTQFHHFTKLGKPFVHGDLKSSNMRVSIDPFSKRINAFIYDFGFSSVQNTEDQNKFFKFYHISPFNINSAYFPKETLLGVYGYKTDVYMFRNIMVQLLRNMPLHMAAYIPLINQFLKRIHSDDYHLRPTSDEVLKFLLTLNRLHLLKLKNIEDKQLEIALNAKLIMLEGGYWQWNCLAGPVNKGQKPFWSNFDFEMHQDISRVIILLYNKQLLSIAMNSMLLAYPQGLAAIFNLHQEGCLNEATVTMLCANPSLSKQVANLKEPEANALLAENTSKALNPRQLHNFFLVNEKNLKVVRTLVQQEVNRLSPELARKGIESMMAHHENINIDILFKLSGSLIEKRELAKRVVIHQLNRCETSKESEDLLKSLMQIDYLYKRQGFFRFFSIHNHRYLGQKVSGTWLDIVKLCIDRKKAIEATEELQWPETPTKAF